MLAATAQATDRPKLVDAVKPQAGGQALKGKFLNYIYAISPEHKKPGYNVVGDYLHEGYAYTEGPYDGAFFEFFLFRGKGKDLVFERASGYEIQRMQYGFEHTAFWFRDGKKTKAKLQDVLPTREMDRIFTAGKKHTGPEWKNYRVLELPKVGTTARLELCKDEPDPPFLTETPCLKVGELSWDKEKFTAKPIKRPELVTEKL